MKVIRILPLLLILILPGCESAGSLQQQQLDKAEAARKSAEEHQQTLRDIRESANIGERTPEEEENVREKMEIYVKALVESVRKLDDNTSPADVIARAAVSENIGALRAQRRAQFAHIARHSSLAAEKVREGMARIPTQSDINEATSVVLRVRKSSAPSAGGSDALSSE